MKPIIYVLAIAAAMSLGVANASADGQEAFIDAKCNKCHAVASVGIEATTSSEKMLGPDLGTIDLSQGDDWMMQFVKREIENDTGKHKLPFKGSDEELRPIVDWIMSLQS